MPAQPPNTAFEPENLLVRSVNWLGDAVMTTPALHRLRERFPRSDITLLTSELLSGLWQSHPGLNKILTFGSTDNPWSIGRRLRSCGFDTALLFPNSPRSALEVWFGRIPSRIGYAGNWRNCLLTRTVAYPKDLVRLRRRRVREIKHLVRSNNPLADGAPASRTRHQMHDYLQLVAAFGADPDPLPPSLEVSSEEVRSAVAACLPDMTSTKDRERLGPPVWLGLNPSAAYGPAKCWPADRFAEVARKVCRHVPNAVWLSFGTSSDWATCQNIAQLVSGRMINLAGKTSLRELMALLKNCRLLLTNDTGPMHVAAALGTPVIVPFGSTSPELTAPGQPGDPRHHLLRSAAACAPCFRRTCPIDFRCMTGITVERVIGAVIETIQMPR